MQAAGKGEEHLGFGESAFAPAPSPAAPPVPPHVPDLWDFCEEEGGQPGAPDLAAPGSHTRPAAAQGFGPAPSAAPPAPQQQGGLPPGGPVPPPHAAEPTKPTGGGQQQQQQRQQGPAAAEAQGVHVAGGGLGGFELLMSASAHQQSLMDADPFAATGPTAGTATGNSSIGDFELLSLEDAPKEAAPNEAAHAGGGAQRSLHGAFAAAAGGGRAGGGAAASAQPPAAHQLSFDADPVPDWDAVAPHGAAAAQPDLAAASGHLQSQHSEAFQLAAGLHGVQLSSPPELAAGAASRQQPTLASMQPRASEPALAAHPSGGAPAAAPARPPQHAASAPDLAPAAWMQERSAGPGRFWETHGSSLDESGDGGGLLLRPAAQAPDQAGGRSMPSGSGGGGALRQQRAKTGADPGGGFVLKDLLSHAVENLRIKNAAGGALSGRPQAPAPSLMVGAAVDAVNDLVW